jgi:hypothetical protein
MEKRYFTKQGAVIWVLVSVSIVRDEGGGPQYFISQIQDITERKRIEGHLHRLADHCIASRAGAPPPRLKPPAPMV